MSGRLETVNDIEQSHIDSHIQQRLTAEAAKPINITGECDDCGEAIEVARLKAHPKAISCIACATASERARANRRSFGPSR